MFTGIVQGIGEVVAIDRRDGLHHITVAFPDGLEQGVELGASVAHNGCCLTVVEVKGNRVGFDAMIQTLSLTNLGELEVGSRVNLERAARIGDEIGGHLTSGHIAGTVTLKEIVERPNNRRLWFALPPEFAPYVLDKGFISIDGASLTISEVDNDRFSVDLIPETLARTTLSTRVPGDRVNLELDPQTQAIVATVERVLAGRAS